MTIETKEDRQVTLLLNPDSRRSRELMGYLQMQDIRVLVKDLREEEITPTQMASIISSMKTPISEVLNDNVMVGDIDYKNASNEDLLKIISNNPEVIKHPIAIHGDKAVCLKHPGRVLEMFN